MSNNVVKLVELKMVSKPSCHYLSFFQHLYPSNDSFKNFSRLQYSAVYLDSCGTYKCIFILTLLICSSWSFFKFYANIRVIDHLIIVKLINGNSLWSHLFSFQTSLVYITWMHGLRSFIHRYSRSNGWTRAKILVKMRYLCWNLWAWLVFETRLTRTAIYSITKSQIRY